MCRPAKSNTSVSSSLQYCSIRWRNRAPSSRVTGLVPKHSEMSRRVVRIVRCLCPLKRANCTATTTTRPYRPEQREDHPKRSAWWYSSRCRRACASWPRPLEGPGVGLTGEPIGLAMIEKSFPR